MLIMVYDVIIHLCRVLRDDIFYKPEFNFRIKFGLFVLFGKWKIGGLEEIVQKSNESVVFSLLDL